MNYQLAIRRANDEATMLDIPAEQESLKVKDTGIPQVSDGNPDLEMIAEV